MQNTTHPTTTDVGGIAGLQSLTDINGLRMSGIFPKGREPSIRTLRAWTQERRIPYHRPGHFVYYDIAEVAAYIRIKLMVPPRN